MFKGFHQTNTNTMTGKSKNMFNGFVENTSINQYGVSGGIVTDNLLAWFNPSINVTLNVSANTVSQWQDTTGTYTLSQSTAVNQPAYVTKWWNPIFSV